MLRLDPVVLTPVGYVVAAAAYKNRYEKHLSAGSVDEMVEGHLSCAKPLVRVAGILTYA